MTAHSTRSHAKIAPSSAHRIIPCPGSVQLSANLPDTESVFAAEGTAAHELASHCMESGKDAADFLGWLIDSATGARSYSEGAVKPDNIKTFLVDHEMVDGVQMYLDVAGEIAEQSEEFEIEERLDMTALVPGCYGTGDAIAYRSTPTRRVTIVDLKYGKGVAVDVEENEQELTYALGVALRYHNRGVDEIELIIVQPRAPHRDGPVRRWTTDIVGLYEHAAALDKAAKLASEPDAPLVPGDWCKFCKAAAICPALDTEVRVETANEDFAMADPETYNAGELADKLRRLPLIQTWCKSLEQFAHAEAVRGRVPPGFKLVAKRAIRRWKDETEASVWLQSLGVADDDLYVTTMATPAAIEKVLPKAERGVIGKLAESKSSGTVLAPIDDARASVDVLNASGFEATEIEER